MGQISYVVVFPTVFSKGMIPQLISNIKEILKIKNQLFRSVKRDGDVILVDANDPVFASSAINLLFGIKKISITRQVNNDFKVIVSEIASIGGNLLLNGERFLVKVDGVAKGFVPKDVEIAATSEIIEKKHQLGAKPGTEQNYDKLLHCHLTKKNAYISIFTDEGMGGIPLINNRNATCCIYDELSAISCYDTIKQGFNPQIIICYRKKTELVKLAKIVNRIIPRMLKRNISIQVFHTNSFSVILDILLCRAKSQHVSIPISYLMFPTKLVDNTIQKIFNANKIPILPIGEDSITITAKELGIKYKMAKLSDKPADLSKIIQSGKIVSMKIGPNNVHDFLDSLENH